MSVCVVVAINCFVMLVAYSRAFSPLQLADSERGFLSGVEMGDLVDRCSS